MELKIQFTLCIFNSINNCKYTNATGCNNQETLPTPLRCLQKGIPVCDAGCHSRQCGEHRGTFYHLNKGRTHVDSILSYTQRTRDHRSTLSRSILRNSGYLRCTRWCRLGHGHRRNRNAGSLHLRFFRNNMILGSNRRRCNSVRSRNHPNHRNHPSVVSNRLSNSSPRVVRRVYRHSSSIYNEYAE